MPVSHEPSITQYPMSATLPATGSQAISTRILEAGAGDDLVICLHGVASRADRFRPVLGPLAAAGYHVYALDLPGHGFATKGALPLSVPFYAEYVAAIAEQLEGRRVTVVGTSLGGQIGAYLTRIPGARLDRLVMVGTLGVVPLPQEVRLGISNALVRNRSVEGCLEKLRILMGDPELATRAWAREESSINTSVGADESFSRLAEYFEHEINDHVIQHDLVDRPDTLQLGLMWGDRDVVVDADTARQCMEALPEVPLVWVEGTGHAPYWERPEAFVAGMEQLFAGAPGQARESFV